MEKLQGTTQHHQQPAATAQPLHEKQLPLHQQQQQQQLHHEKEAGHGHIESSKTTGALETAKSMAATGPIYTKTTTYGAVRHCQYTPHPNETMQAAVWSGTRSVSVATVPRPILSSATDAIVDITATCICGSDLHFYNNVLSGSFMQAGDILGHEAVGIVREVGGEVHNVKVGDRVVISAIIACGKCEYCKKQQFSLCDSTNPSQEMADMYGYRLSGVFGYSSLTGGYAGLQAEVARVPFADANLLKISNDSLSDEQIVLLSDVLCTAWHGLELSNTNQADTVCIWGCGPIGLMSSYLAKKVKHAYRVLNIDNIPYRLNVAKKIGCETVNFDEHDVIKHVKETVPGGPDVCIDCVGFRFPKSTSQKFMFKTGMQTDAVDCVREAIVLCKKGGNISLIGDYFGTCNEFPVGALMEKSLTVKGGQLYCQRYWKQLLSLIESGEIDPTWLLSHRLPFQEIEKGYEIFNARKDNCTKIVLFTKLGQKLAQQRLQHLGSSGGGEGGTGGFVLSSGSTSSEQEHHHAMSQLLLTRHQEEVHDGKPCPPSCNFAKGMATSSGATNVGGGGTETATGLGGELPRK